MSAVRPHTRHASEFNPFERSFSDNPKENQGKGEKGSASESKLSNTRSTAAAAATAAAANNSSNNNNNNNPSAAATASNSRNGADATTAAATPGTGSTSMNGRRISERNRNNSSNSTASVIPPATTPSKGIAAEPSSASSRSDFKIVLPPVASITSPSGDSSSTSHFPWGSSITGSLRAGPLSPAMLAGPQSSSNNASGTGSSAAHVGASSVNNPSSGFDPQSFRTGFTPDLSNFRTGLTPLAGGPTSFPPPSPNTAAFLAMVTNGPNSVVPASTGPTITPNTLAALTGTVPPPPGHAHGHGAPGVNGIPGSEAGPNGSTMAANGLFLLSQAQQMEMAKQDDPEAAAAAELLQGVSQISAGGSGAGAGQPGQPGAPNPAETESHWWPGAISGTMAAPPIANDASQPNGVEPAAAGGAQQPNGTTPKKGSRAGANKRKQSSSGKGANAKNTDPSMPQLPVAKRTKTASSSKSSSDTANGNGGGKGIANHRRNSSATTGSDGMGAEFDFRNMPAEFNDDDDDDDDDGEDGEGKSGKKRGSKRAAKTGANIDDDEKRKNFLERNRQAALKCRQRKKAWLASLQARVEYLTADNEQLQTTVARQAQEIMYLKSALGKAQSVAVQHGIPAAELQVPPINMNAIIHPHHQQHLAAAMAAGGMPMAPSGAQPGPVLPPGVPIPSSMHSQQQQAAAAAAIVASAAAPNPAGSANVSPVNPTRNLPAASGPNGNAATGGSGSVAPSLVSVGGAAPGVYSAHAVPRPGNISSFTPLGTSAAAPSRSATPAQHVQAVG